MSNEVDKNKAGQEDDIELDEKNLGIAGRIARQFINSPVTPLLMMAFLGIGLLGLMFTPRQEDPQISVPRSIYSYSIRAHQQSRWPVLQLIHLND